MPRDINALRLEQNDIARRVSLRNELAPLSELKTVAGADISCNRFSKNGFATVVVMSYPDGEIIEKASAIGELDFPYIPGYLAFREWPLLKRCLNDLSIKPGVLICDGQGIAHHRRAGLASHVGVLSGLITVGCAKSRLIGEYKEPAAEKGSVSDLLHNNQKIGEVLRTRNNVKPLFISPGHRIDFKTASQLILSLCPEYRQPLPIRAAHNFVNQLRISIIEWGTR
ncbi:MAG: endonuclease V [Planctomycetes bacterium]|nr:endonuclease V [Planctomycetota bacterium]